MISRKLALGVMAIALIWISSALADQMTITQTAKPIEFSYPGVSLDILGIKPGMSVDAAQMAANSFYKSESEPFIPATTWPYSYKSITMFSQKYISRGMKVSRLNRDSLTIQFGSPATGNVVLAVTRVVFFNQKTAPTVKEMLSALVKKYGPATSNDGHGRLSWYFGKNGIIKTFSGTGSCASPGDGLANDENFTMDDDKRFLLQGVDVCIGAEVTSPTLDQSRVELLSITLNSPAEKDLDETQAVKQLRAAAVAAYMKETPTVPKL